MAGWTRFLGAASCLAVLAGGPALAAGPVSPLAAAIVADPYDAAVNLAYAREQEAAGELGRAFAAYERVHINHPDNVEAALGMQRVRRLLQPTVTRWTFDAGIGYESNPRHDWYDSDDEQQYFGRVKVVDERTLGFRLRTEASLDGIWHQEYSDLDFLRGAANTGPLLDVSPDLTLYPALGVSFAGLDHKFYYSEVNTSLQAEGSFSGAYQISRIRLGYRDYDDAWVSDDGFYADWMSKLTFPKVLGPDGVLVLSPTVRWSDVDGNTPLPFCCYDDQFEPGVYWEVGTRIEYLYAILDRVTLGANVELNQRWYKYDTSDVFGETRQDFTVEPGASVIFRNLVGPQTDIRLDYKYVWNDSNAFDHTFDDHIARLTFQLRR